MRVFPTDLAAAVVDPVAPDNLAARIDNHKVDEPIAREEEARLVGETAAS